jgi:hypothetical protein
MEEPARADINVTNALAFFKASFRGKVPDSIAKKRAEACAKCPHRKEDDNGFWCGAPNSCGCGLHGHVVRNWFTIRALDMTLYREIPPYELLCYFPGRMDGLGGWPLEQDETP